MDFPTFSFVLSVSEKMAMDAPAMRRERKLGKDAGITGDEGLAELGPFLLRHRKMSDGGAATLALLQSCATLRDLHQVHAQMIKTQHDRSSFLAGKLVAFCSHRNLMDYALSVFAHTLSPGLFARNSIIHGYLQASSPHLALLFFASRPALPPNSHTFPLLFKACAQLHNLLLGKALHGHLLKIGFHSDLHAHTALLYLYASCGQVISARKLFAVSPHGDCIACWNAIISGLVKGGRSKEALELFYELLGMECRHRETPLEADEITIVSALAACTDLGALDSAKWIHEYALKNEVRVNVCVGTALVDAYAKCGSVDLARRVFDEMPERNVMSWTVMIRGLAMFGQGREALALFSKMVSEGGAPDDVTFVGALSACTHSRLVDEGRRIFDSMGKCFNVSPKMEHYGCMVDLLSRVGLLKEALDLIESMPMKPDAALWGSLLSACRRNPSHLELAEYVAGRLMEIEPYNDATYVLLSNIYGYHNRWEDVGRIRTWMKARGISKTPGCSSVELDGVVHEFIVGDKSHPDIEEIHAMVEEIEMKVVEMGHVVDTSEVLLDIEEHEKMNALMLTVRN
ncbi:pentatricopeptide repeat-containing protein At5g66520 [Elaeis guineensis]|uniref:pentatricopeptide repeat-containing protein At5g66520 n=1 Tax=Elaeis guineensis var. tenera TaxID=51953 RepID=UPI003C6DA02B